MISYGPISLGLFFRSSYQSVCKQVNPQPASTSTDLFFSGSNRSDSGHSDYETPDESSLSPILKPAKDVAQLFVQAMAWRFQNTISTSSSQNEVKSRKPLNISPEEFPLLARYQSKSEVSEFLNSLFSGDVKTAKKLSTLLELVNLNDKFVQSVQSRLDIDKKNIDKELAKWQHKGRSGTIYTRTKKCSILATYKGEPELAVLLDQRQNIKTNVKAEIAELAVHKLFERLNRESEQLGKELGEWLKAPNGPIVTMSSISPSLAAFIPDSMLDGISELSGIPERPLSSKATRKPYLRK